MSTMTFQAQQVDWEPFVKLAARLGVEPTQGACLMMHIPGQNGSPDRRYDVIALVNALLDKLDAAEKKTHKPIGYY